MSRWFFAMAFASVLLGAQVAPASAVALRDRIEANGAMVTLGDVFEGTGALAGRPIAPAPPAGQLGSLPMAVLGAAAAGAGLDWTPPPGVDSVQVVHPGGARATIAPPGGPPNVSGAMMQTGYGSAPSSIAIRRGDAVMLVYQSGGVTLSMRTQAMQDAAIGQSVRLTNPSSNRVVLGLVTGPGAASASP